MKRVFLHTFGCKANQYDTEVLRQALEGANAVVVGDPGDADAAVVNSCTVTHVSEAKMRSFVRRIARQYPACSSIAVIGCAATLDDGLIQSIPGVTAVIGGTNPEHVLEVLGLSPARTDPVLRNFERGSRAWLKVQDGCDEHCTYCATRLARGSSVSRPAAEVIEEAEALASMHAEVVLTGVHIGNYGKDTSGNRSLSDLVAQLIDRVPDVRVRLSSVEATQIDGQLLDLMTNAPDRLAPHIHAPLQSGSDRVLKLMGRHWYTAEDYRLRLEKVAERVEPLGLGADIIVGFPGETDEDFAGTRSVVEALPFTYLHVFPYSPRPGTPSGKLGFQVDPGVVKERSTCLRTLVEGKRTSYDLSRHGTVGDVVLLERAAGRFEGITEDYLTVFVSTEQTPPRRFPAILKLRDASMWAEPEVG